ncbi:MAG TPA: outer membrane beta-barrel protein [Ignavibacteria bacterium]|nr:outer membrane beta-barrel protein [Ignavibacteria bacterium]
MKLKKLLLLSLVIIFVPVFVNAQYLENKSTLSPLTEKANTIAPKSNISLGIGVGPAFFKSTTGINLSFFTEVAMESFSIIPQANYWKVNETNNFELAGDMALHFAMAGLSPYGEAGLGVNFYDDKDNDESFTALGLNLGLGLEFKELIKGATVFVDGRYKLIIRNSGNKEHYVLTGGVKLPL